MMVEPVKPSVSGWVFVRGAGGRLFLPRAVGGGGVVDVAMTVAAISVGIGSIFGIAGCAESGWVNKHALKMALAMTSPFITMVQYVSPCPIVLDAIRKGDASNLPTRVFQTQAACNILSIAYGIQITNVTVLVTNMVGLACQILYLACDHHVRLAHAGWIAFTLKLTVIFNAALYIFSSVMPINVLGDTITLFNIILSSVPLLKLGVIMKTRDASSWPTAMTFIAVANNYSWSLLSLMIQDVVLFLPSILALAVSMFQVMVILWCRDALPFGLGFLLILSRDGKDVLPTKTSRVAPTEIGAAEDTDGVEDWVPTAPR